LEAASLNEAELAEYCRHKGLYVMQITSCQKACLQIIADRDAQAKIQREQTRKDHRQIKQLEQEPHRKAEVAAMPSS
jgi:hypothetical protein